MKEKSLTRFAWLSIGTALTTICLKFIAFFLTGSIGLLSDALESFVNLAAAVIALIMLRIAEKPPDKDHLYGHNKAEYFASVAEGFFILIAAISIMYAATGRLLHPQPIEQATFGLIVSAIATVINFVVAMKLLRVGKKYESITLEADGHHLMTDVWTSVGVIAAVIVVAITRINIIDPIIAILVAINIVFTGFKLIRRSMLGLMDSSIEPAEITKIHNILDKHCTGAVKYHGLRTRQSATRRFASFHVLVPGKWTVQKGHDLLESIEYDIRKTIPKITVFTHIEPIEDPVSFKDESIDRE